MSAFLELVRSMCKRPGMYVRGGRLEGVCDYLNGYGHADPECPIGGSRWEAWNVYVAHHMGYPSNVVWSHSLGAALEDREGLAMLPGLVEGFIDELARGTPEEIAEAYKRKASPLPPLGTEGLVFACFLDAVRRGDEVDICRLATPHERLNVLWDDEMASQDAQWFADLGGTFWRVAGGSRRQVPVYCHMVCGVVWMQKLDDEWLVDPTEFIARVLTLRQRSERESGKVDL